jgi:ankyrin repeat protein
MKKFLFVLLFNGYIIGQPLLHQAIRLLIDGKVNETYFKTTALHTVAFSFCDRCNNNIHLEMLTLLLKAGLGAKVNEKDEYGRTALHLLMGHSDNDAIEAIKLLLKSGANVDEKNNEGRTALHLAAIRNNPEAIKLLLQAQANLQVKDNEGRTARYLAEHYDKQSGLKLLEEAHAQELLRKK